MADENVLEEFLVNVLYNVDERKRRDFNDGLVESFTKAKLLGDALESMAARGVAAIERYVNGMERLYYVSRNTGASVQNLQALGFATAQLGGNAEDAVNAVQGLITKLKETPGTGIFIKNVLGVQVDGRDPTMVIMDIVKRLEQMPAYLRQRYEGMVGLTEQQFLVLSNPGVEKQMERFKARQDQMGLDPQKAAADAAEFMRAWRDIGGVIDNIASLIMSKIVGGAAPELTHFADYLAEHGPEIADVIVKIMNAIALLLTRFVEFLPKLDEMAEHFGGWDKVLLAVGAALLLILTRMSLLSSLILPPWLLVMLGVTGAAVAGTDAAKRKFDEGFNAVTPGDNTPDVVANENMSLVDRMKRVWRRATGQPVDDLPSEHRRGGGPSALNKGQQRKNAAITIEEMRKAGYNDNAIAAVVGSMQTESSFNPRAYNGVKGGHTGAWQWDRDRWPKIEAWIKSQGGDPYDWRWQSKAWIAEHNAKPGDPLYDIQKTEIGGRILKNSPTLPDAIHGVQMSERFGAGEEGGRAANASQWLPHLNDVDAAPVVAPPQQSSAGQGDTDKHDDSKRPMPANMPPPRWGIGAGAKPQAAPVAVPPPLVIPPHGGMIGLRRAAPTASALGIKPIGGGTVNNTSNAPQTTNHFNIDGAASPKDTANAVHQKISDVHSDVARNMRNGVG